VEGLIREMVLLGTSLLTLFNPPSAVAAFATIARPYPRDVQIRMARRTALFYCLAILVVTWAGRPLLSVLGLSLPALRVAGGFVLMMAAVPMVSRYQRADAQQEPELEPSVTGRDSWVQVVAVPLTFPISIGGATVAAVIASSNDHPDLMHALGTSVIGLLMTGVVWLSLASAVPLTRRISRGSMAALTAFSGLLLLCIAFQVMAAGVRDLLPGLAHPRPSTGRTSAGSA
jgi:multiple antibiotic resistance protein